MPLTTHTLTLTTLEPDNVTPIEGKWRVWFVTEHGAALNNAGAVLAGSDTATTTSGVATLTLPDTEQAGFDPAGAYYRAAFVSTDRRVRLASEPFLMGGNKTTADIFIPTDLPITPSLVARAELAADQAEAALAAIGSATAAVTSVNTQTGAVVLTKADVGLSNVDNTSDANKPVSTAQAAADSAVQSAAATDATTKANAAASGAASALASHEADTTNIHGITNTAALETTTGAQSKADAAQAFAIQRANHTGTQSADTLTDGTTNKAFLATERTKLSGVATGATANSSDATLLARANHTGTQASSTISDLTEAVQDIVGATLSGVTGATVSYDDTAGTITITGVGDPETMRDTIGAALVGVGNISVTVDDTANTITIATTATVNSTDATLLARANHTGTQSADTLTDGTTNKAFLATERTKLSGIATGATANSTDATLLNRANHTGSQAISTVTNLQTTLDTKATDSRPSYITTARVNPYDPEHNSYNVKPSNTRKLRASLARAMTDGIAEWMLIGDSFMAGSTTTGGTFQWSYKWPTYMRDGLAGAGVTIGGTGMIRALWDAQRWSYSANWLTGNTTNVYTITNGAAATFTPDVGGDRVTVYYYNQNDGGTFTISVNGATSGAGFTTITTTGTQGWAKATLSTPILAGQTVVITKTNATGFCTIAGAATWTSTGGLIIHNVAEGSATAADIGNGDKYAWGLSSVNGSSLWQVYASPTVSLSAPDVLFIGLGANDIDADATPATVTAAITAARNHYAPNADVVLVLTQQPINTTHVPNADWEAYAVALYDLADTLDCPLIDFRARVGNYAATVTTGLTVDGFGHFLPFANADLGSGVAGLIGGGPTIEAVDDRVAGFLTAGAGVRTRYNDTANTLTLAADDPSKPTGAIASTVPRWAVNGGGGAPTAGQTRLALIWLEAGLVVSNITLAAGNVGGAGLTASLAGLYTYSATAPSRVATSANVTTATWTANTARTYAMTTPYTVVTSGYFYIAFFATGTTMPGLAAANASVSATNALPPIMGATGDSSLTTSLPTTSAAPAVSTITMYAYVS